MSRHPDQPVDARVELDPHDVPTPDVWPDAPPVASPGAAPVSRRAVLLAGLSGAAALSALGLTGCVASSPSSSRNYIEPNPIYPPGRSPAGRAAVRPVPPAPTPTGPAAPPVTGTPLTLRVIPRATWTRAAVGSNIHPLNGVHRITVHHAGGKPYWSTDAASTYRTLESIRGGHRAQGWADIGYHFIVDRAGRVLEGRPLRYQGAHVSDNNEHNIGVMALGNFNDQRPATAQLNALNATLNALAAAYRIPVQRVYTHRELGKTACPGASLQNHMDRIRSDARLARG